VTRIDVLEMDIEGAEPRALEGMRELPRTRRPTVLVESSPELIRVSSRSDPADFLAALGATHRLHIVPRRGRRSLSGSDPPSRFSLSTRERL